MPRKWTQEEEIFHRELLQQKYIVENKTIAEIATELSLSDKGIFSRLVRLGIATCRESKASYPNKPKVHIPPSYSTELAEFFGIMLGDGHVSHSQITVTLGTKELAYVEYVALLMTKIFGIHASISIRPSGYRTVYIGSTFLSQWIRGEGLVTNKVRAQVDIPRWIWKSNAYMEAFVRGFFDTDGSVYLLRYGIQISFTNRSIPLLVSLQSILIELGYKPSRISSDRVYITRKAEVKRFFTDVRPANTKHIRRYEHFRTT